MLGVPVTTHLWVAQTRTHPVLDGVHVSKDVRLVEDDPVPDDGAQAILVVAVGGARLGGQDAVGGDDDVLVEQGQPSAVGTVVLGNGDARKALSSLAAPLADQGDGAHDQGVGALVGRWWGPGVHKGEETATVFPRPISSQTKPPRRMRGVCEKRSK